jgi:hypothetical protein
MNDPENANEAWRIDTLDSRGGLAFASFRASDLDVDETLASQEPMALEDGPAISISPPDFRPESVSSRAIGLAAGRGAFQFGLFVDGKEVGFASLADIVEFVRRCYLSGAGGDGPDGGGSTVPPRPEGKPPDFPPESDFPSVSRESTYGLLTSLITEIKEFADRSAKIAFSPDSPVKTDPVSWDKTRRNISLAGGGTSPADGCHALVRGAVTLILEMLRRYPISGVDEDLLRWHCSAQSIGRTLWRLGLWPFLLSHDTSALPSHIHAVLKYLETARELDVRKLIEIHRRNEFEPAHLALLSLFGGYWHSGGGPATIDIFFRYPVPFLERFISYSLTSFETTTDPVDDLSGWPIPNELAGFVIKSKINSTGADAAQAHNVQQRLGAASVLGLMTSIQGSPSIIADSPEASLEIALLGAAHIIRDTEPDTLLGMPAFAGPRGAVSSDQVTLHRRRVNSIAATALDWFVGQLPQHVFPEKLEQTIRDATNLSYND